MTEAIAKDGIRSRAGTPALGRVLGVGGARAKVRLTGPFDEGQRVTVGKFMAIHGASTVVGVITEIRRPDGWDRDMTAEIDLLGEIRTLAGKPRFQRGVTEYPMVGDPVAPVGNDELRLVYDLSGPDTINIGVLQQDESIGGYIKVDDMLSKHFAVLGTTGVGKSSGVAAILQQILEVRPLQRIFLIDPHNEYGRCFGDLAHVLNPKNVRLPFWLFNFEETVDVFFRGRPGQEEEVAILSEVIPIAKARFAAGAEGERALLRKSSQKGPGYTADTPVPYRLADLLALIDERIGKLENRSSWLTYTRLMTRIETVRNDPRYAFMFDNANVGGDTMVEVVGNLFRLPANGKPMTVMQLAGFPAEVVDSVVSVLGRMAFDFGVWSDGAVPLLFVCEEAHRYAPADRSIGFGPTRKALSRISKEGRKYGVFLGLVTQRPAELDPTILSQCSTLFAMRMANENDHRIVKSAVSDAAASLLSFVPTLGTGEVFAFGEGVALPTRLRFRMLPAHLLPKSESAASGRIDISRGVDESFIGAVIERWRGATMSNRRKGDAGQDFDALGIDPQAPPEPPAPPPPPEPPPFRSMKPGAPPREPVAEAGRTAQPARWGRR